MNSLLNHLKEKLQSPLPGNSSHRKMMEHREPLSKVDLDKLKPRKSAVLILLYPKNDELYTTYILRPEYPGVHSGQIAFPGGKMEETDSNLEETALREAFEEVNINPQDVEVLGQLTELYVPPSNFLITPFVGYQSKPPNFIPQISEVSKIIESPLSTLLNPQAIKDHTIPLATKKLKVKGFYFDEHIVWGATAMITKELVDLITA